MPFIYLFLAIAIIPLKQLGINYLHVIFLVFSIIVLFPNIRNSMNFGGKYIWNFIFSVIIIFGITVLFGRVPVNISSSSTLIYIGSPVFWILFYNKVKDFNFLYFKKYAVYIGFIISILGIVQFLGSKTIYGLIPSTDYFDIDFTRDHLVDAGSHFRVRSILSSSQIFGLYCSLAFCMLISTFNNNKKYILFFGIPILIASLLSGQRIVILIYIIYFSIKIILRLKYSLIKSITLSGITILFLIFMNNLVNDLLINQGMSGSRIFDIFFNAESVLEYERNSRWERWANLISEANLIIGEGIGYTDIRDTFGMRYVTSESYIFQLYFEGGIFVLFSFLLLYFKSIVRNKRIQILKDDWILLLALFFALISVHSFLHPVFFVFWGIIVYPFTPASKMQFN